MEIFTVTWKSGWKTR